MSFEKPWFETESEGGPIETRKAPLKKQIIDAMHSGMIILFSPVSSFGHNWNSRRPGFLLLNVLATIQLASLLAYGQDLATFSRIVFSIALHTRVDYIFITYFSGQSLLVFLEATFITFLLLSIIISVRASKQLSVNSVVVVVTKMIAFTLFEVIALPMYTTLVDAVLGFFGIYGTNKWLQDIPNEKLWEALCVLTFPLFTGCNWLYIVGTAELRHFMTNEHAAARASSDTDLIAMLMRTLLIALLVVKGVAYSTYTSFLVIIIESYLLVLFTVSRPYFSDYANIVKSCCCLSIIVTAGSLMVGHFTQSDAPFYLLIFLCPSLCVIYMSRVYPDDSSETQEEINPRRLSASKLERALRPMLCSSNSQFKIHVISALSEHFTLSIIQRAKITLVWEANYCMYNLQNTRLARMKLARHFMCHYSLEADFQIAICNRMLDLNNADCNEELIFLQSSSKLERVKADEKVLSRYLYNIFDELELSEPSLTKLTQTLAKAYEYVSRVEAQYSHLTKTYPERAELLQNYEAFLSNVLKYTEKAMKIRHRFEAMAGSLRGQDFSYFDSRKGIAIVSCDLQQLGRITFVNPRFCEMCGVPAEVIAGSQFSALLPYPLNLSFEGHLKKYLLLSTHTSLDIPSTMFFVGTDSTITEVALAIRCIAVGESPIFITSVSVPEKQRDVLILSPNNMILYFTSGVGEQLELEEQSLYGQFLDEVIPGVKLNRLRNGYTFFSDKYEELSFEFHEHTQDRHTLRYVFVYNINSGMCNFDFNFETNPSNKESTVNSYWGQPAENEVKSSSFLRTSHKTKTVIKGDGSYLTQFANQTKTAAAQLSQVDSESSSPKSSMDEYVLQFSRLLSIFKWVVCAQIAAYFATEAFYLYCEIGRTQPLQAIQVLSKFGELKTCVLTLGDTVRRLDLAVENHEDTQSLEELAQSTLPTLEKYDTIKKEALHLFPECSQLQTVLSQDVSVYDSQSSAVFKFDKLDNIISKIIWSANSFLTSQDATDYEFVLLNSMNIGSTQTEIIRETLQYCADQQEKDYRHLTQLAVGLKQAAVGILSLLALGIAVQLRKLKSRMWQLIRKAALPQSFQIKQLLLEVEGETEPRMLTPASNKSPTENVPVRVGWFRYLVISILIYIVVAGCGLLDFFVLESHTTVHMNFFLTINDRAIQSEHSVILLNFWTRETMLAPSLSQNVAVDLFMPPSVELQRASDTLITVQHELMFDLLPHQSITDIQAFMEGSGPATGLYEVILLTILEAHHYSMFSSLADFYTMLDEQKDFPVLFKELDELCESSVATFVDQAEFWLILRSIGMGFLLFGVLVFVILPLKSKESSEIAQRAMLYHMVSN